MDGAELVESGGVSSHQQNKRKNQEENFKCVPIQYERSAIQNKHQSNNWNILFQKTLFWFAYNEAASSRSHHF